MKIEKLILKYLLILFLFLSCDHRTDNKYNKVAFSGTYITVEKISECNLAFKYITESNDYKIAIMDNGSVVSNIAYLSATNTFLAGHLEWVAEPKHEYKVIYGNGNKDNHLLFTHEAKVRCDHVDPRRYQNDY